MASKILVDEISPQTGTDVVITATKKISGDNTQFKITGGANLNHLQTDGAGNVTWVAPPSALFSGYALFADQKAQNTAGGTFTQDVWQTRDLNTSIANTDTTNIVLGTNQFTLLAGSYLIKWSAPASMCDRNQTRLYDITGAAVLEVGSSAYNYPNHPTYLTVGPSSGFARITPGSSNIYRIEHRCSLTKATDGFGLASNVAAEQYTMVEIIKEA
jgi:hypothetical protein